MKASYQPLYGKGNVNIGEFFYNVRNFKAFINKA